METNFHTVTVTSVGQFLDYIQEKPFHTEQVQNGFLLSENVYMIDLPGVRLFQQVIRYCSYIKIIVHAILMAFDIFQ